MTIEEKVREIFQQLEFTSHSWNTNVISTQEYQHRKENYLNAILAMIKPMSKERLEDNIVKALLPFWNNLCNNKDYPEVILNKATSQISDAILAVWEKGLR